VVVTRCLDARADHDIDTGTRRRAYATSTPKVPQSYWGMANNASAPMTGGATQSAIEHHYDVGREFYDLWLDPERVYSCALWEGPDDDDLAGAQQRKLAWHADSAGVVPGSRVLDVGCGWGAMLRHLVTVRHVEHATGLTLSSDQLDAVGPATDRLDARLEDWRAHDPSAPYDAIVSIGAFEHFSRPELRGEDRRAIYADFFQRCSDWLVPGGRLSLQTIGYEDYREGDGPVSSFFTDEIFPESTLPHLSDIVVASEPTFRVVALRSDGDQYERTLHLWQQRLEARKEEAVAMVGRDTYRRYVRYLRVSRAMFDRHVCTLYRLTLERRAA
jgi:cyclopropane-fatty-acyl-phospholipid synthase